MIRILLAIVAGLLFLKLIVFWAEARLAFFPLKGIDDTPRLHGIPFEELNVTTADGETINAWLMPHPSPIAEVLYFHGNGGNLSVWLPILSGLHRRGLSVVAFDYRGYGNSTGAPSEGGLTRDTDAILERFWSRRRPGASPERSRRVPVVYWGRSLGGVFAAYAAAKRPPDRLILESGFSSMRAVVRTNPIMAVLALFSSYSFPTARHLEQVKTPALVMHGDRDSVIPFPLGEQLYADLRGPKRFYRIPGGDHNDAAPRDADAYWAAITRFIRARDE